MSSYFRTGVAISTVVMLLVLSGCSTGDPGSPFQPEPDPVIPVPPEPEPPSGDAVLIELIAGSFRPAEVTVERGSKVRWINRSGAHTVTPEGHNAWESQFLGGNGQVFEHVFDTVGSYAYFCEPHVGTGMRGVIRVVEASGSPAEGSAVVR